eukprot:scaffold43409_cov41-Cyclotella_meneghiniana.AAC.11
MQRPQTEIALSTMEAEYVVLSQACKDLFPLLDMVKELGQAVGVKVDKHTNMHVQIHEDNVGALTLGNLEPKRMTPRSKHYSTTGSVNKLDPATSSWSKLTLMINLETFTPKASVVFHSVI